MADPPQKTLRNYGVVVVAEARVVVVDGMVVVADGATVVVPALVVAVVALVVAVVRRLVVVDPPGAGVPLAPDTWKVTSARLEIRSRLAGDGGRVSGAVPETVKAVRVASTSLPKSVEALLHTADTRVDPSGCGAGLTIRKRLARLAVGPPRALPVVLRVTTSPGNAGLWPGLTAAAGAPGAPASRSSAGSTVGSLAVKVRTTTIPRPPLPCTEPASGDSTRATTGVTGTLDVVVGSGTVGAGAELSLSELQDTRATAARTAPTRRRRIPHGIAETSVVVAELWSAAAHVARRAEAEALLAYMRALFGELSDVVAGPQRGLTLP